ncbi:MAG: thrombospondin type 3 repeat-containing protein, partial [Flavobacteriaceae bacterium]
MKFILNSYLLFLSLSFGFAQTEPSPVLTGCEGVGMVYYKSFSIFNGDGSCGSHPTNASEFTDLFDYENNSCTEWTHTGRETATKAFTWPWPNILPKHDNSNFGWEITSNFVPVESGDYIFQLISDDKSDFFIDSNLDGNLTNTNMSYSNGGRTVTLSLSAGSVYPFRIRYIQGGGSASLYLKWQRPSGSNYQFFSNEIFSSQPTNGTDPLLVTNNDDSGCGSLRGAISHANSISGLSTITFDSSLNGTITLLSDLPTITRPLSIIGNGTAQTIIDGNNSHRIFFIHSNSLNVSNITMHNMRSSSRASAIYSISSQVIADNIKLFDFRSTAIFSENAGSTIKVINSTIEDGDGYIFNSDWGSTPTSANEDDYNNRIYFINSTFENINNQFSFTHRFVKYDGCTFKNNNLGGSRISYFNGVNRFSVVNCLFENNVMGHAFYHNNHWNNWNENNLPSDHHSYINNTFRNNTFSSGYIVSNQLDEGNYYTKQYTISGNTLVNNVDSSGNPVSFLRDHEQVNGPEATIVSNTFEHYINAVEHKNSDSYNRLVVEFIGSNDLYILSSSNQLTPIDESNISISISGGSGQLDSSNPFTITASSTNLLFVDLNFSTPVDGNESLSIDFDDGLSDSNYNKSYGVQTLQTNLILADNDDDGISNVEDNCIEISNSNQTDTDNDGIGDRCDDDDDNDGVLDDDDDFPFDPNETVDTDGDGVGDNSDNCLTQENADQIDTDQDGQGDECDDDDDNDGVLDDDDELPLDPNETVDTDGDGVGDNSDNCLTQENADQIDTDQDGQGDECDDDDDNDGVLDEDDDFPFDPNETVDTDGDGIGDNSDNCANNGDGQIGIDGCIIPDATILRGGWKLFKKNNFQTSPIDAIETIDGEINGLTRDDDGPLYLTEDDSNYDTAVLGFNHPNNYTDEEILDEFVWYDDLFDRDALRYGQYVGVYVAIRNTDTDVVFFIKIMGWQGYSDGGGGYSYLRTTKQAADIDSDNDGVPDEKDGCVNTPAGHIVNANGCTIGIPGETVTIIKEDYESVVDVIGPNTKLSRNDQGGLFNSALESSYNSWDTYEDGSMSPRGVGLFPVYNNHPLNINHIFFDSNWVSSRQRNMPHMSVINPKEYTEDTVIPEFEDDLRGLFWDRDYLDPLWNNESSKNAIFFAYSKVDNIYFKLKMLSWTGGGDGGGFAYERTSYTMTDAVQDEDVDQDGIGDSNDNCPNTPNSNQSDIDNDGIGDVCDDDIDGDQILNSNDNCPSVKNIDQKDFDNDGIGDICDGDIDNDGYLNENDVFPLDSSEWSDNDKDGTGDNADLDDDNDGYVDLEDDFPFNPEEWLDTDQDGVGNNADKDDDNDGVEDYKDAFPLDESEYLDTDDDGIGN